MTFCTQLTGGIFLVFSNSDYTAGVATMRLALDTFHNVRGKRTKFLLNE
jgi:hypothetical protein